jgi:hypothetical protein
MQRGKMMNKAGIITGTAGVLWSVAFNAVGLYGSGNSYLGIPIGYVGGLGLAITGGALVGVGQRTIGDAEARGVVAGKYPVSKSSLFKRGLGLTVGGVLVGALSPVGFLSDSTDAGPILLSAALPASLFMIGAGAGSFARMNARTKVVQWSMAPTVSRQGDVGFSLSGRF